MQVISMGERPTKNLSSRDDDGEGKPEHRSRSATDMGESREDSSPASGTVRASNSGPARFVH